ncbi:MAG: PBP1A family penicillin-binding protein [Chloroflexi bacterium]|nr:PBP1A family penicillin-binding protein [Chloroflexota bacterium]
MLAVVGAVVLSAVVAVQAGTVAYAALTSDLPSLTQLNNQQTFKTAQIFDRNGTLLWEFYDAEGGRRTVVPLSEISQYLIDATLATEDPNFYDNPGVDLKGIVRAFVQNLREQDTVSGASTITQQLVRRVLLDPREAYQLSYTRKLKEAILAFQVTRQMEKSQILQLYLNEIYYGDLAYGIEAAAQQFFGKKAKDLDLAEASMLAGLPQAPADYDPINKLAIAKARQAYVLDQMARHEFITEPEAAAAKAEKLNFVQTKRDLLAPHWVMFVRNLVEEKLGPRQFYQGGLRIFTTLDLNLQRKLEEVAKSNASTLAIRDADNTAILAINPKTGEILAMVGSMDYWNADIDGQVNVAISQRQPGSSIKPLVYATAFGRDYVPSTPVRDEKISLKDGLGRTWSPTNFDNKFHGTVTLRTALGNSLNIPAVRVLEHIGLEAMLESARRLGITTWTDRGRLGLSLTLGGAEVKMTELADAYVALANNGKRIPLASITKIVDSGGRVLEDYRVPAGEQVLDPRAAYMVTNILTDNTARLVTYGPNSLLKMDRPVAVKTGTTDNYRDTWTVGYSPNLVVSVWVGNTDGHPMKEVLSSMSAGKIWRESFDAAVNQLKLPAENFERPPGLVEAELCDYSSMRPGAPPCYKELFPVERAPKEARLYLNAPPTASPSPAPAFSPEPAKQSVQPPAGTAEPTAQPANKPPAPAPPTGAPTTRQPAQQGPATAVPAPAKPTAQPRPAAPTPKPVPTPKPR